MLKKVFLFLFFFVLTGAVFSPFFVRAEETTNITLSQSKVLELLDITRKEPLSEAQFDSYFSTLAFNSATYDRQTGAIVLVKQAILAKQLDYWFREGTLKFSKNLLNLIIKLAPMAFGDYSGALKLIEKYTVEKANEYAMDWFTKNALKIGTGKLQFYFKSYKNNWQNLEITYLITYSPKDGDIIIEFYSTVPVEPPIGTDPNGLGSSQDNPKTNCWPWDIWVENEKNRDNDGKLEPFIARVEGKVEEKSFGRFEWQAGTTPTVEIIFDKPVPQINPTDIEVVNPESALKKKLLGPLAEPLEKIEEFVGKATKVKEAAEKVIQVAKTIFNVLDVFDLGANISTHQAPAENQIGVRPLSAQNIEKQEGTGIKQEKAEKTQNEAETPAAVVIEPPAPEIIDIKPIEPEIPAETKKGGSPAEAKATAATTSNNLPPIPAQKIADELKPTTPAQTQTATAATVVFCKPTTGSGLGNRASVIFNEIAWMGSKNSANDEWIELKNISSQSISLKDWQIINQKEKIQIGLENIILKPGALLLLERTNDESAPQTKADVIFTGGINNTDEALYLLNPNCVLQDKTLANPYWPAGDNSAKKTMERTASLIWQTSQNVAGTPRQENSVGEAKPAGGGGEGTATNNQEPITNNQTTTTATTTATATPSDSASQEPTRILITEIQIASASSSVDDFIELFNFGAATADISGYKIKKKSSTGNEYSVKVLADNTSIRAGEYFLWANSEYSANNLEVNATSTQTLAANNSIAFFDQNDNILDQVAWGQAENQFVETTAFANNPELATTLSRKYLEANQTYQNTDNNSEDFEIGQGTPKAKNMALPAISQAATSTDLAETGPSITTLTAGPAVERGAIDLFWLATSSQKYIVLMNQSNTDWDNAPQIAELAASNPSKEVEKITLQNLEPDKTYFFAVQFIDLMGATSILSNIAQAKTRKGFLVEGELLTDKETGLVWPKNGKTYGSNLGATTTQLDALTYISDLDASSSFEGFSDWRIPNFRELATLLSFTKTSAGPIKELENIKDLYWTSSKFQTYQPGFPGDIASFAGWAVDFTSGNITKVDYSGDDSPLYCFLPARGQGLPDIMPEDELGLIDNNDNTATDPKTNLMWAYYNFAQTGEAGRKTWPNALRFALNRVLCNDNSFLGNENEPGDCSNNGGVKYDDWRVPNVQELIQVVKMGPSLALPWQGGLSYYYWTATENGENKAWAAGDGYLAGAVFASDKTNYMNVQIVRDSN